MLAIQQPQMHYIQNELYSNYSNINGHVNYAEVQKTNNDGQLRIRKNINGKKMEYYVLRPRTFSDNNMGNQHIMVYPLKNTSNHSKHKKRKQRQHIITKSKRIEQIVPDKREKQKDKRNKSVKKQKK